MCSHTKCACTIAVSKKNKIAKTNNISTINQKVDQLNKLTMIAMTSKDAYIHSANKEVCEFINLLKSEGYSILEGDELDQ